MSLTSLRPLQRLRAAQCLPKLSSHQLRTYFVLRTVANPTSKSDQYTVPTDLTLPNPPKTTILLTTPDSAATLSPSSLSSLTNDGTTTVLAAVVDSLPVPGSHRTKGHSWLFTDHQLRIKTPPPVPTSPSPDAPKAAAPINKLTLTLPNNALITLPLAPTLFQTGTPTTMVHIPSTTLPIDLSAAPEIAPEEVLSFAEAREDIKEAFHELQDLIAGLSTPRDALPPNDAVVVEVPPEAILGEAVTLKSEMPLRPLTKPRKVKEAFGNILRTVEGEAEDEKPASRELEEVVKGLEKVPKAVYARITRFQPEEGVEKELVMKPGVRMHRVLSGGGGWGAKAGLLSLDPQSDEKADVEKFAEMFEKRFEGEEGEGEDALVTEGEWVQFFEAEQGAVERTAENEGELRLAFGGVEKEGDVAEAKEDVEEKVFDGLWGGRAERWVDFVVGGKRRRVDVPGGTIIVGVKEVDDTKASE